MLTVTPATSQQHQFVLEPHPEVRIGSVAADTTQLLSSVAAVRLLYEPLRILVADTRLCMVLLYDRDGNLLTTFGRAGEGPAEFLSIDNIAMRADTLFVFDWQQGRLSSWLISGAHLSTARLPTDRGVARLLGMFADGSLLLQGETSGAHRPGLAVLKAPLLHHPRRSPAATLIDSVVTGRLFTVTSDRDGVRGTSGYPVPLAGDGTIAVAPGGYWSSDGSARLMGHDENGAVRLRVDLPEAPRRVTPEDRQAYVADRLEDASVGARPRLRRVFASMPFPEHHPVVRHMVTAASGELWVVVNRAGRDVAYVVAPDGDLRGMGTLPAGFALMDVGHGYVVGLVTGRYDVPFVEVFRLQ